MRSAGQWVADHIHGTLTRTVIGGSCWRVSRGADTTEDLPGFSIYALNDGAGNIDMFCGCEFRSQDDFFRSRYVRIMARDLATARQAALAVLMFKDPASDDTVEEC